LEGRWAQLTVDAHIAHAIDYSKPVKPFIEEAILDRLEIGRNAELASTYPVIADDGSRNFLKASWVSENIEDRLLSWSLQKTPTVPSVNIYDRISQLKEVQKTHK
jgi:hypothetical protein